MPAGSVTAALLLELFGPCLVEGHSDRVKVVLKEFGIPVERHRCGGMAKHMLEGLHVRTVPFVCGATNLGEALRRINEGAAMIRSKGEAGTGDVSNATTHMRQIRAEILRLSTLPEDELYVAAKELQAPYELVKEVAAPASSPSCCSPPAASPPRPTRP